VTNKARRGHFSDHVWAQSKDMVTKVTTPSSLHSSFISPPGPTIRTVILLDTRDRRLRCPRPGRMFELFLGYIFFRDAETTSVALRSSPHTAIA